MTGRVFLTVQGCDGSTTIALDHLTGNELGLLTEVCAAITGSSTYSCEPSASLSTADPDAGLREPSYEGDTTIRPLSVVVGTALTEWVGPVLAAGRARRAAAQYGDHENATPAEIDGLPDAKG